MPLRIAIFDFDLTLSAEHVFNLLSNGNPPAKSERGQLAQIAELDKRPDFRAQGGFAYAMMGGQDRVAQLRSMLSQLRGSGVDCLVCTKGLVGPVRKVLEQVSLLSFFSGVYGKTGEHYGQTAFDAQANPGADSRFLGNAACQLSGTKQQWIKQYMSQRGLGFDDVLFIDDDVQEVMSVGQICQTIQVSGGKGMGPRTFAEISRWQAQVGRGNGLGAANMAAPQPTALLGYGTSQNPLFEPRENSRQSQTPAFFATPGMAMAPRMSRQEPPVLGSMFGPMDLDFNFDAGSSPFYFDTGSSPFDFSAGSSPFNFDAGIPPRNFDTGLTPDFAFATMEPTQPQSPPGAMSVPCEVYSKSDGCWCPGHVVADDGEMVAVNFTKPGGSDVYQKRLPKGSPELNMKSLKAIESMVYYETAGREQTEEAETEDDEAYSSNRRKRRGPCTLC